MHAKLLGGSQGQGTWRASRCSEFKGLEWESREGGTRVGLQGVLMDLGTDRGGCYGPGQDRAGTRAGLTEREDGDRTS